jgi:hypothetical protein
MAVLCKLGIGQALFGFKPARKGKLTASSVTKEPLRVLSSHLR